DYYCQTWTTGIGLF
nr:immunoglobulin light chain junction region [Macaca mulatta]MOW02830.1 immunoglobulin light chain junction region [Macaca mulatta]MOW03707.1 immunoglobulin light chain junction region [Macaca mulatta]MOX13551.1 immunoglobulin light chain junction region [Macaca mulatta]MOX14326.1 immunoglobulin light chain junction region [Macaca mulatta]